MNFVLNVRKKCWWIWFELFGKGGITVLVDMRFLVDWFDPYNIEHIRAYRHLQNTGIWPCGFISAGVVIGSNWQILIASKLSNAWVDHMLAEENQDEL